MIRLMRLIQNIYKCLMTRKTRTIGRHSQTDAECCPIQCQILPDFHISNRMGILCLHVENQVAFFQMGCFPCGRKPEKLPGRNSALGVWMLRLETVSDPKFFRKQILEIELLVELLFPGDCSAMRIKRYQRFDTI